MIKKIFLLWDNHTIGFVRVLFFLLIPAAICKTFAFLLCNGLLLLWLIVKTGYEKEWGNKNDC